MPTINTTDPKPGFVYDSDTDTWYPLVGIAPASTIDQWVKTMVGGETSVSGNDDTGNPLAYTVGTEQVYLNGVLLVRNSDYTATNGTSITGFSPAFAASDVVEVITYNPSNIEKTNAILTTDINAKGDLIVGTADNSAGILSIGTNGQVLKVNTSTGTGLEWGSDSTYSAPTIGTTSISSGATVTTINGLILTAPVFVTPEERVNVVASAATGTVALDALTAGTMLYTSNSTGNWTLNVRGSATTSLNDILTTGDSITVVFLATNGSTAYYQTAFQIDGGSVTPKWQGGTAPSAGNASSIDAYVFNIIKTASATFTVLASQTKFA